MFFVFAALFSAHLKSLSATHCRVQVALCTLEVAPASSSRIGLGIGAPRARRRPKIHPPDSAAVPERFSHVWWNTLGMPWGPQAEAVTQERGGAATSERLRRHLFIPPLLSLWRPICVTATSAVNPTLCPVLSVKCNFSDVLCVLLPFWVFFAYVLTRTNCHKLRVCTWWRKTKNKKQKTQSDICFSH